MKLSKKKAAGSVAGVLALTLVAGSWAYYTSTSKIDNNLHTNIYADRTVEEFTPDQEMEPGSEIIKKVGVENTGDYDLVVRIKMEESWSRGDEEMIGFVSSDDKFGSVEKTDSGYIAEQQDPADGQVDGDESVIYKNLDLVNWTDGGDGYWYYNDKLAPGAGTGELLNSIIMATNADMGKYDTPREYYSTADKAVVEAAKAVYEASQKTEEDKAALEAAYGWVSAKPDDVSTITYIKSDNAIDQNAKGYAGADYKLSIITEVCQATRDAVSASWTTGNIPDELLAKLN